MNGNENNNSNQDGAKTMMNNNTWKIEIEWSENPHLNALGTETGSNVVWTSFGAFTSLITALAHTAPADGCYDKTKTHVTHLPSGEVYSLRLDITHPDSPDTSDNDLLKRLQDMCSYMLTTGLYRHGPQGRPSGKKLAEDKAEWTKWAARFADAQ